MVELERKGLIKSPALLTMQPDTTTRHGSQ
jgi:hypothetical protein